MKSSNTDYGARAAYYDFEFNDMSDRDLLQSLVQDETKAILEIPCGSGRNVEWLAQTGVSVTFGDLSEKMVGIVDSKIIRLPFPHKVRSKRMDMLNHTHEERFDLILVPREGLQLLRREDLPQALISFKHDLSGNGLLYLDVAVLDMTRVANPNKLPRYISEQNTSLVLDIDHTSDTTHFTRRHSSILQNGYLEVEYEYTIVEQGILRKYSSHVSLAQYNHAELLQVFDEIGLIPVDLYGSYDKTPYSEASERIICILKHSHE